MKKQRSSVVSVLSTIGERHEEHLRFYLAFIGQNAERLTEAFCKAARQEPQMLKADPGPGNGGLLDINTPVKTLASLLQGPHAHQRKPRKKPAPMPKRRSVFCDAAPYACKVELPKSRNGARSPTGTRRLRNNTWEERQQRQQQQQNAAGQTSCQEPLPSCVPTGPGEVGTPSHSPSAFSVPTLGILGAAAEAAKTSWHSSPEGPQPVSPYSSNGTTPWSPHGKPSNALTFISSISRSTKRSNSTTQAPQTCKICCWPVDSFADPIPACRDMDVWRCLSMVYLIDTRKEDPDTLPDLRRRLHESHRMLVDFAIRHDVPIPVLMSVVLWHRPPSTEETGTADGSHECSWYHRQSSSEPSLPGESTSMDGSSVARGNSLTRSGSASTDRLQDSCIDFGNFTDFVEEVGKASRAAAAASIVYTCNFDDPHAVLRCIVQVTQDVGRRRKAADGDEWEGAGAAKTLAPSCCGCNIT